MNQTGIRLVFTAVGGGQIGRLGQVAAGTIATMLPRCAARLTARSAGSG